MAILRTAEIKRDPITQMRESSNANIIFDFSEDIKRGDHFPAIEVFNDGENYWLSDGWYRVAAHEEAGVKEIQANVHDGTLRDATEYAMGCNGNHGRERDDLDIRKAIRTALEDEEWGKRSDAEIGRMVKISGTTVGRERKLWKEEKKNGKPKDAEPQETKAEFSDNGIEKQNKDDGDANSDRESAGVGEEPAIPVDGDESGDEEVREVERGGKRYNMKTKNLGGKPRGRPKGKGKKKKERAEKDEEGKVIPHDLTGVFGAIEIFDNMANLISQVQGLLKKAKDSPAGSRFRIQPIQVDLDNARKAITASTPYAVCPGRLDQPCKRSCERCGGENYLDKTQFAALPKSLRKPVEAS